MSELKRKKLEKIVENFLSSKYVRKKFQKYFCYLKKSENILVQFLRTEKFYKKFQKRSLSWKKI